jgi:cytoskeletal protein RodZ
MVVHNSNYNVKQDKADFTDMPVGEILRRTREYYGLSLHEVESVLRIRACQLEALETGDLSKLPGRVYAIGFVRTYAEYLGLEGDKVVHLFKNQAVGNKSRPELSFPIAASESKLPNKIILVGSFIAFITVIYLWSSLSNFKPLQSEVPPVPASLQTAAYYDYPLKEEYLSSLSPASGQADELIHNQMVINIIESTWIEIRNAKGDALLSRVLNPGDSYTVPYEQGLVLDAGNAAGIELILDGNKLRALGQKGDILKEFVLDPDQLILSHSSHINNEVKE